MDDTELQRRIGTVLCGKWTLERLLGSGSMGAVYVGVHKIGRRDAIKILHPEIARTPELRARFEQEAHAVNRFEHPGAVEIRDVDTTADGCPFLVMELLEGESLADRVDRLGRVEIAEILAVVDGLLDVLAAAHAHGIIHRDIKPANLFCLRDGRLKVLDFGVARVRQAADETFHTRTGTRLGTVAYMSPEQVRGTDIDARADLFAVGATMFRLIAKRRIHVTSSDAELVVKMATLPAPSLASGAPETPRSVCAIVDRALAFKRDERYPSALAMQQDIRAVRASHPLAVPNQLVMAAASDHAVESVGTARTVALPNAGTALLPSPGGTVAIAGQEARAAQRAPGSGSAEAKAAARTKFATAFTQLTRWEMTTVQERKLRRVALVFPLLGAGVLAIVYYRAVHVDPDATPAVPSTRALKPSASPPARSSAVAAANRTAPAATNRSPAEKGGDRSPPPSGPPQRTNCMLAGGCDYVCNEECDLACKNRNCEIGARRDALVTCTGSLTCKVSCEGDCTINCGAGAPCLVHCAPRSRCVINECPQQIETCGSDIQVCGAPCPG